MSHEEPEEQFEDEETTGNVKRLVQRYESAAESSPPTDDEADDDDGDNDDEEEEIHFVPACHKNCTFLVGSSCLLHDNEVLLASKSGPILRWSMQSGVPVQHSRPVARHHGSWWLVGNTIDAFPGWLQFGRMSR